MISLNDGKTRVSWHIRTPQLEQSHNHEQKPLELGTYFLGNSDELLETDWISMTTTKFWKTPTLLQVYFQNYPQVLQVKKPTKTLPGLQGTGKSGISQTDLCVALQEDTPYQSLI